MTDSVSGMRLERLSAKASRSLRAPTAVLAGLCLLAVALFAATTMLSRAYREMHARVGQQWFAKGQKELQYGHTQQAILDFRNALSFQPHNDGYFLKLAQTLVSGGDFPEARGYLLTLWDRQPGSGVVNLELARLETNAGNTLDAVRYYQNAIYGVWENDPEGNRRTVRFELAEFLLAHHDRENAEADLIALGTDLPRNAELHTRLASLFLRTGDAQRALAEYKLAVRLEPQSEQANLGAGEAAFQSGDYQQARKYFDVAARIDPQGAGAAKVRMIDIMLRIDPFRSGLTANEQTTRIKQIASQELARIEICAKQHGVDFTAAQPMTQISTDLADVYAAYQALSGRMKEIPAQRDKLPNSELLESLPGEILAAEQHVAPRCGQPNTGEWAAALLVLRKHAGERR